MTVKLLVDHPPPDTTETTMLKFKVNGAAVAERGGDNKDTERGGEDKKDMERECEDIYASFMTRRREFEEEEEEKEEEGSDAETGSVFALTAMPSFVPCKWTLKELLAIIITCV